MTSDEEVRALVVRLGDRSLAEAAATFPSSPEAVRFAGLYSWWSDAEGLDMLSTVFDAPLPPLIYAGQTGATTSRSRTERVATLASRIGGNHLNGNVGSSTFRKTLTSALLEPLDLRLDKPEHLAPESNRALSAWMRAHLSIVTAPCADRGTLAALESAVLQRLDPPLNLQGMQPSRVRRRLRDLRKQLAAADG